MIQAFSRWAPLLIVAVVWEVLPRLGLINPASLPPLTVVLSAWLRLALSGDLAFHGASSFVNLASGLGLAIVAGTALGLLMARQPVIDGLMSPVVKVIYPLPKSALIPILMLWFGLGMVSKIASIFLGCLLPVLLSAYNGARGVDQTLVWSALAAGTPRARVLRTVILPGAMPDILAGIRNALALSFILLVSAELLTGQRGFGFLISFLGDGGAYDSMFAVVLTVSAAGFLADRAFLAFTQRVLIWRE